MMDSTARFGSDHGALRSEDEPLLTGSGRFTDDLTVPGQAYGVFVRAPVSHAAIREIDLEPARATFKYRKKKDRREYVRVYAKRNGDGILEVTKYPREGAGLLSSLTETDGFAELAEDVTSIEPGDTVGFLPYGNMIG